MAYKTPKTESSKRAVGKKQNPDIDLKRYGLYRGPDRRVQIPVVLRGDVGDVQVPGFLARTLNAISRAQRAAERALMSQGDFPPSAFHTLIGMFLDVTLNKGVLRTVWRHITLEAGEIGEVLSMSIESLPDGRLTDAAIDRFNRVVTESAIDLRIRLQSDADRTTSELSSCLRLPDGEIVELVRGGHLASPAYMLWSVISSGQLNRLKRCGVCESWFADESRNVSAKYCSPACTNRYWNRTRRRTEGGRRKRRSRR